MSSFASYLRSKVSCGTNYVSSLGGGAWNRVKQQDKAVVFTHIKDVGHKMLEPLAEHPRFYGTLFTVIGILGCVMAVACISGLRRHSMDLAKYMPEGTFHSSPSALLQYKINLPVNLCLGAGMLSLGIVLLRRDVKETSDCLEALAPSLKRICPPVEVTASVRVIKVVAGLAGVSAVISMICYCCLTFHTNLARFPSLPAQYRIHVIAPERLANLYRSAMDMQNVSILLLVTLPLIRVGLPPLLRTAPKPLSKETT